MLQKLKEAGITAGLRSSNIRVVDPALIPRRPSRPNKTRNILLSIMVGLLGGIGLALLREYLDNTVKTPDDIETLARLPSLAVVPALVQFQRKAPRPFFKVPEDRRWWPRKEGRAELISHNMPQSQMSEAFRALRTSLLLSQADHPPQVILMTSALAARRQDYCGGESGGNARAAGRQDACWWTPTCASPASIAR